MISVVFRAIVIFIVTFGAASAFLWAGGKTLDQESMLLDWRKQRVEAPVGSPPMTSESIDIAMAMYGIQLPSNVERPYFDARLSDRGLTIKRAWHRDAEVKVGPAAYSSWALLGSTLAHEIEVHCRQNFFVISLLDRFGFQGTVIAERQAYRHELIMADRFGLSQQDRMFIADTVHHYYPLDDKAKTSIANRLNKSFESILLAK